MPVTKSSGESWGSGGGSSGADDLSAFGGFGDPVGYAGSGYGTYDSDSGGYKPPPSDEGQQNMLQGIAYAAQQVAADPNLSFTEQQESQYLDIPEVQRFMELANRMTDINFARTGAVGDISSLNQLAMRAGLAPMPSGQGMLGKMPSFLGAGASAIGQWATGSMYEDITQKGYIPQYDARGQIVATINPETGQLGRGSVESRIDYNNPDTIAERSGLQEAGVSILDDFGMGRTSTDETPEVPEYLLGGQGGGVAEPVTEDISMIPTGQIAAGGTPMYRQTLLDVAPTQYGGLLAGTTPSDFDVANRAFRMTGATYPEYFTDPYSMQGYSILT
jgi:hypothetical protein